MIARLVQNSRDAASSSSSIPDTPDTASSPHPWRKEKECFLCKTPVGNGFLRTKKHVCKFCYHAVCSDCSPGSIVHDRTRKQERVCTTCEDSLEPDPRGLRRAVTSLAMLEETEEKLNMETALRQAVESKFAVAVAAMERRVKEMEETQAAAEKAKKEAEELAVSLSLEREKAREREELMGKIAEVAWGQPGAGGEVVAGELLARLHTLAQVWTESQRQVRPFTCDTFQVASIASHTPNLPESLARKAIITCESLDVASIPCHSLNRGPLSLASTSISLPGQFPSTPPQSTLTPTKDYDTSTTPSTHPRKSLGNAPESPSKCLRCEELMEELSKLRSTLAMTPRMSRAGSLMLKAPTEVCQCTTT